MSELPEGWVETTIKDVSATIQYGYTAQSDSALGDAKYLRITDIQAGRVDWSTVPLCEAHSETVSKYRLRSGDIVFARTGGTVGKSYRISHPPDNAIFASYLVRFSPRCEVAESEYLEYFFQSDAYWQAITDGATGTGQPNFNGKKLAGIIFPLPPLAEQGRIVEKLDALSAQSRAAATALTRIETLITRYKAAVIRLALHGELTTDLNAHEQQPPPSSELFAIPENWEWRSLPEIGELARGKSKHRPRNDPALFGTDFPFIQTGDVKARVASPAEIGSFYNALGLSQSKLWPAGTLMITIAANIADTHILPFEACFPDSIVGFTPDVTLTDVRYIEMFFRVEKERLDRFAPAVAQKNINLKTLENVLVPLPPLEEQAEIVARIEAAFAQIETLARATAAARARLDALDRAILARAFKGKLVPQNPNDEPASELLKRLKEAKP